MKYEYYDYAHTSIGSYVSAMWQTAGQPAHQYETILPTGVIELLFSFAGPLARVLKPATAAEPMPPCFISGIITKPLQLRAPAEVELFGVRLMPLAVRRLLRVPAGEFRNHLLDLRLLNPIFGELTEQLAAAGTFGQRRALVAAWMQQRLRDLPAQEALISSYLSGAVAAAPSVTELASRACYSPRQLSRKSHELFGLSAEALLRYKRYVAALAALHQPGKSLTEVGLDHGFYDQSHFIREFQSFAGMAPGGYRRQLSVLPGHLFE